MALLFLCAAAICFFQEKSAAPDAGGAVIYDTDRGLLHAAALSAPCGNGKVVRREPAFYGGEFQEVFDADCGGSPVHGGGVLAGPACVQRQ